MWLTTVSFRQHALPSCGNACLSLDRAEECRRLLTEQGLATITKGTGAVHVNPLAKLEKEHRALYAKLLGQLCLRFH